MKKKNICRPIVLYNNFVPPTDKPQEWGYEAFGYYDGITVKDNLFLDDSVDVKLDELWYCSVRITHELKGEFSSQVLYGFRSEDDNSMIRDQEFWADEDGYPFLFVVTMRLKGDNDKFLAMTVKLEEYIHAQVNNDVKAITYLMLDNSDMILVLRCNSYDKGTRIVNSFHKEGNEIYLLDDNCFHIQYSFTVCGVNKRCINSDQYSFVDGDKVINRVCFRIIERFPGSVKYFEKSLCGQPGVSSAHVEREQILGCEDEVIYIEGITWNAFLSLYKDASGLLSNTNEEYGKYVLGITSVIPFQSDKDTLRLNRYEEVGGQGDGAACECSELGVRCRKLRAQCEQFFQEVIQDIETGNSKKSWRNIMSKCIIKGYIRY